VNDSWSRFWERLLVDWVAVAILGFTLQGVWFGAISFLMKQQPAWEAGLTGASAKLGIVWLLAIATGLAWGVKRAWDARLGGAAR
jgi:hypothetical protein